jgi:hypothetical protein
VISFKENIKPKNNTKSLWIKNPLLDRLCIIYSPLLALLIIIFLCKPRELNDSYYISYSSPQWLIYTSILITFLHIKMGFVRSHLNHKVFMQHKKSLILFPVIISIASLLFNPIYVYLGILAIHWDEYHSFKQTFGIGRIYERLYGCNFKNGYAWDILFCFTFEYMPHVILITYMGNQDIINFLNASFGFHIKISFVNTLRAIQNPVKWIFYTFSCFLSLGYIYKLIYAYKRDEAIAFPKYILFLNTAAATILCLYFYSPIEASIMGNIYHGIQYINLIWAKENKNIGKIFPFLSKSNCIIGGFIILTLIALFISILRDMTSSWYPLSIIWLTCSLTHFFADGLIWRKHIDLKN